MITLGCFKMSSEAQNSETMNSEDKTEPSSYPLVEKTSNIYKNICHTCPTDNKVRKQDRRRLILASIFCLLFMVAEIIGGVLSNSLAIASDAGHLLGDFGTFMVSLTALWLSSRPQTSEMSFGFHRAEVLGALISVLSLWLITGVLDYLAIQRLINSDYELDALIMIYVSVGGALANILMWIILKFYNGGKPSDFENEEDNKQPSDSEKEEDNKQPSESENEEDENKPSDSENEEGKRETSNSGNREDSLNIRSAILHVIGDLLQSIAVLVASLVIYFYPHLKIIDPICTFLFSIIILITTLFIMRDILCVLMEGFPKHMDFNDVKDVLYSIPGVVKIHNMRMWSLTMDKVALSAHIVIRKGESPSDVLKKATRIINTNLDIYEVTLQIEESGDPVNECITCA